MAPTTTRLQLRVAPRASGSPGHLGPHRAAWKGRVAPPPERGRANDAVLALLAETLAVPRSNVALVSGGGSRNKIVELTGIEPAELERRLAAAGGQETG